MKRKDPIDSKKSKRSKPKSSNKSNNDIDNVKKSSTKKSNEDDIKTRKKNKSNNDDNETSKKSSTSLPTIYDSLSSINTNNTEIPKLGYYQYITSLLCCVCLFTNHGRKVKRQILKQNQVLREQTTEVTLQSSETKSPDQIQKLNKVWINDRAAIKIQSCIRGFLTRHSKLSRYKIALNEALSEANRFWLYQQKLLELQSIQEKKKEETRAQITKAFVNDLFDIGLFHISQSSEASTEIQRIWRGHRTRKMYPIPIKQNKWERPAPKIPKKNRFSAETLRRVWSRTIFEPEKRWLHSTDYGQLYYNMWDYIDVPPEGVKVGLRTHKTNIVAKSKNQQEALLRDHHAWVGLPIGFESSDETRLKEIKAEPDNVTKLKSYSPYNAKVVNYHDTSLADQNTYSETSSHSSKTFKEQMKNTYNNFNRHLDDSSEGYTSQSDNDENYVRNIKQQRTEQQVLKEFEKLGFDSVFMDPVISTGLPRIGTLSYDLQTGRRIIHKGGNLWVGVHNPHFIVQYENHINTTNQETDNINSDINSIISINSNLNLLKSYSHLREHKSGTISYVNNDLNNLNSSFLKNHRSAFLSTFSKHDLSDYSGLQNSQYYDVLAINGQSSTVLKRSQNVKNDSNKCNETNNNQSISLKDYSEYNIKSNDSIASNNLSFYPRKVISFTKDGNPIRGARKPRMQPVDIANHPVSVISHDNVGVNMKSSSWGKLKIGAEQLQQQSINDTTLRNRLNRSVIKGFDLENDSVASYDLTAIMNDNSLENDNFDEYDSDEDMWKNRSVFKPKRPISSKVAIWKKSNKQHYKLKYNWLPQPLLHNAVNNVYYEKTVRDFYSDARERNSTDFKKEIFISKEKSQLHLERSSMLHQVQDNRNTVPSFSPEQYHISDSPSKYKGIIESNASAILSLQSQGYRVEPSIKLADNEVNESFVSNVTDSSHALDVESQLSFSLRSENVNSADYDVFSPGQSAFILKDQVHLSPSISKQETDSSVNDIFLPTVNSSLHSPTNIQLDEFSSVGSASAWNEGTEMTISSLYSPKSILKTNSKVSKRANFDSEFENHNVIQNTTELNKMNHFVNSPHSKQSINPYITPSNVTSTTPTVLSPKFKYKPVPPPISELITLNKNNDYPWR